MSVCAVLLVKDEDDIIGQCLRHLLTQVDEILLWDNLSSDRSAEIMVDLAREHDNIHYKVDTNPQHYQSRKMTALALEAFQRGHRWVLPIDPDEIWYAPEGRPIKDFLDSIGRETQFVKAAIYNHVCTALDPVCWRCAGTGVLIEQTTDLVFAGPKVRRSEKPIVCEACLGTKLEPNPLKRIQWRQRVPLDIRWGKIACRCRPDLMLMNGNHEARTMGVGTTGYGLEIRHYPYRSAEQFVKKALSCYHGLLKAKGESEGTGAHCRAYGKAIEEGGVEAGYAWFNDAFYSLDPEADDSLVHDPLHR